MIEQAELIYNGKKLAYRRKGCSKTAVLCFHGFGESAEKFDVVQELYPTLKYLSVDLPFHGLSEFDSNPIIKEEWKAIIDQLIATEDVEQLHIISYSLGGRFLIRAVCDFPEQVKSCEIIASDGFHYTFWYNLAVHPMGGNQFFAHQMHNPKLFFQFCDLLDKYKIINPSVTKFARLHLHDEDERMKVYRSWTYMKSLKTNLKLFSKTLVAHDIPVNLYTGEKDYIIKTKFFEKFQRLHPPTNHIVLKARHHEMIAKWTDWKLAKEM